MVHRPSDPRLLLNLISHEKNYSKHLQSLLDSSHASLTSLSAFAATSAEPVSGVILSIVENFSNADDALCRYKDAVDAWREQLLSLKELETEIASIARDREILVTRVLKASKHEKPPKDKDRTSALAKRTSISHSARFASESSLSLSIDHSSYSPSSLQTSTKLENAQAELRACETHLTVKEAELEVARVIAIRDGLRIRCDALIDCGQAWVGMGQNGIRISAGLQIDRRDTPSLRQCQSPVPAPHLNSPSSTPTPHHTQDGSGSTDASHRVSEVSTIGPSQSASQVNAYVDQNSAADPFIIPNAPNPILGANGSDVQGNGVTTSSTRSIVRPNSTPPTTASLHSVERPVPRNHSMIDVTYTNKPAPGFEFDRSDIRVPAAHAIRDGLVPTITPSAKPKTAQPSSGYLTPVSNDDTDDGRREENERVKQRVVERPRPERQVLPTSQVEDRPEAANVGGYAPKIVPDATDVQQSPPIDDLRRPIAPPPGNNAPVPVEEPRPPPKHRRYSESSSVKKSGFLSSLKRVFGTGTNRQYSEDRAREREVKAWEKEGKRMEKEDRKNEKKEERMERARLRGVRREEKQREAQKRNEQREREKEERLREERRWKPSDREARMLRADSSTDDERLIEEQEVKRIPKRVNLIGRGKREQKSTPDEDDSYVAQRESEEVQDSTSGYIVKQNLDLQKNLRGGVINSGHVAPFDMFTGGSKARSDGKRRSTTTGIIGDQRHLEGRTTGGSFVFERGAKMSQRPSAPHPATTATSGSRPQGLSAANVPTSTEPFPAPVTRPSGLHSTIRSDTKFWENISNRSGSPVQVPPTINERGESGVTTTVGQGGVDQGSSKQRLIAVSQPHNSNVARGRGRDITAPAAMSTPKHQMMNGNTRRAISANHGRSISVSSLPAQARMPAPITGQHAVPSTAEPGESLMSIVDGLARSNRRAWNMGLMEVSRSRENMRLGMGHELRPVGSGSGGMTKGKSTNVAVINDNQGNALDRINTTGYDNILKKDEVVSAKTLSSLAVESLGNGSPRPAPVIKGVGHGDQDDLQEGEDDSASTSSYETGEENFQLADEEMQKLPAGVDPASVSQKQHEVDRRTVSPPPAIRFKAPDRADSASPASRGEPAQDSTPRRRKSVRVSLNPTFSPTPPAIEDEVDQHMRAPFVFEEQVVAPPSVLGTRNQSRGQAPLQSANANGVRSKDLWDDDGEANTGYEEAKKLFMMAARRERDVMW